MAEVLESFEFKSGGNGGKGKHPWNEWLDGKIRKLTVEDWGTAATVKTIMMSARKMAKLRGMKVRMAYSKEKECLVLQAYVPEVGEVEEPDTDTQEEPKTEPKTEPAQEEPKTGKKGRQMSREDLGLPMPSEGKKKGSK